MPKIIPDLKSSLIQATRKSLLESESHDISIRELARECGTAIGTVYNYFPSKEALIAEAMMSDWLECSRSMRKDAKAEDQPMNAIRATAAALWKFTSRYQPMWRQYADEQKSMHSLEIRHNQIIAEISDAVKETLVRFDLLYEKCLPEVIAELVLLASRTENGFDQIAPVMERILR
jgi:AcrR family transcriptional regulator